MPGTEHDVAAATPQPRTRESLAKDLRQLGLAAGNVVIVHCSLSSIGWVSGGATTVIMALLDAVVPGGTLVMPAQSTQLSDPADWRSPAIPAAWHEAVRASLPAFDPRRTPTRGMGAVAELLRTWPGIRRSPHPTMSLAALGPAAEPITRAQPLDDPFGEMSPLGCLYRMSAHILLLGVGFERCTALHLAQRRAWPDDQRLPGGAPMLVDGRRQWVRFQAPPLDTDAFPEAFERLLEQGLITTGLVGSARACLMPLPATVDAAAAAWRQRERLCS